MTDKKKVDTGAEKANLNIDDSQKTSAPKARATTRKPKAAAAEDKVEAVTRKARSTARKVAAVVSDTVKEIAKKVGSKSASPKKSSAPKSSEDKPVRTRAAVKRTKVGALSEDFSSEEVLEILNDSVSSDSIRAESDIHDESATDVKEHFFHDQHIHAGPPPPQPPRDVPDEYGDTKIVLMVRDPEWSYAYWEINDETRQQLNIPRDGHHYRQSLRLYKVSGRNWPEEAAHYFFDLEVGNDARSWYIHMPEPDQDWCAELGILDENNTFTAVCRSNVITLPRNTLSTQVDSEWMTVEESFEKITRMSNPNLEAQLRGESYSGGSETILRHIHRQLTGVLHGERAALSSGIFSSESPIGIKDKDFWLQVHTELILYGATEPDAKVTVQGQPVALNADGTFSIRFALPDGEQVLEVRAKNADGDMEESVTPVVRRHTR